MSNDIVEERLCGITIRRRRLPYRISGPYADFCAEEAKFSTEFMERVVRPLLLADATRLGRMWGVNVH